MNIEDVLKQIPEIPVFLSVEEMDESTMALQKQYPKLVSVDQVGESEKHHPIYRMRIGKGKKKALIFGCPHPNEPIGSMMLEHFAHILCENEELREQLDTTFHIIKCVDPDGLKLNEGWLKGPFTYYNYASHFFRPAGPKQVEWTFPFHYKKYRFDDALPETKAIMNVIDEVKPDFMYSLHNSSFGGVYWYVSKERKEIVDRLENAAKRVDLPLSLGEPEVPFAKVYRQAVYEIPQSAASYDFYEANLDKDPSEVMSGGGCSADYLDTKGKDAWTLVCEMPYFYCPDSNDLSLCENLTRREAIVKGYEIKEPLMVKLKELYAKLEPYADPKSSCMIALKERVEDKQDFKDAQFALMDANPQEYDVPCTVASRFDSFYGAPWYTLIAFGMVISAAKETLASLCDEAGKQEMDNVIQEAKSFCKAGCDHIEKEVPCEPIPIRKLVSVQMESALLALGMNERSDS